MSKTAKLWAVGILALFALSFLVGCAPFDPHRVSFKIEKATGGHGSGTHIGNRLILTAAHVVEDREEVTLTRPDGTSLKAKTLWRSPEYDIAILRYEGPWMPSVEVGCGTASEGSFVTIAGNPGPLRSITFRGYVASKIQEQLPWRLTQILDVTGMPGVSGGGVFDARGRLIGILVGGFTTPFAPVSGITLMVPASAYCQMVTRA